MPVTVEHDIADHQDSGLIESRHGQLHGATHIQNEQGRDISTGFAMACDWRDVESTLPQLTAPDHPLHDAKRAALDLDLLLILILSAPSNHAGRNSTGIWGVNRQGCRFSRPAPWMARGGGPPNHWRITGTPSPGEVPSGGARAFCLLCRFCKVSRRQGGTLGGRYRRNGYVLGITALAVRPPSPASPLPQLDRGVSGREVSSGRPPSQASQLPQLDCGVSGRYGAAGRPSSQASQLPHLDRGVSGRKPPPPQQHCVHLLDQVISACTGASRPMACRRA